MMWPTPLGKLSTEHPSQVPPLIAILLLNVGIGVLLRLILPTNISDSAERFVYIETHDHFPVPGCPSFPCYRILAPLIAKLWPLPVAEAFSLTGLVFHILGATMLWQLVRALEVTERRALIILVIYWTTWGAIYSLWDIFLLPDPAIFLVSITSLYCMVTKRYLIALAILVVGAAVKEAALLMPLVYALYSLLVNRVGRQNVPALAGLIIVPLVTWIAIRGVLRGAFGYQADQAMDLAYLRSTYFFHTLLPEYGLPLTALYIFAAFGLVWLFAVLGFPRMNRDQKALTLASIGPMVFLALYQAPDRALPLFLYALALPASAYLLRLPTILIAGLLLANGAFTVRMAATVPWLPPAPVLLVMLAVLAAVGVLAGRHQGMREQPGSP